MLLKLATRLQLVLVLLVAGACHKTPVDNRYEVLSRVRGMPSALPGLSVERAVDQVLTDMQHRAKVENGRWYCNRAIESDGEDYKVGYEFTQNGKTTRFGWVYHADGNRIEPLTDYARQVAP